MKRCPQCNRVETDDALAFCRVDGARLVFFDNEPPTAVFSSFPTTDTKTRKSTSRGSGSIRKQPIDSIAVLPFANAGDDPNAEYLSDGITEEIINNLSQLPKLKIMARSTVFSYKGQQVDARRAGNELGVRAIVTGRVQQLGDRLTIGIELVDAADGSQLWGERYSRQIADIFTLQEEIAEQITSKLRMKLTGPQKKRLGKRYTKNSEAYQLYLKGRYFWNKRTEEDAHKGIECFHQALTIDANFALAYTGLADCQTLLGDVGVQAISPKEAFTQAQSQAARALELDDSLAEGHGTLGHLSMHLFDWPTAERELLRAVELNPNYAPAWFYYAYFLAFTGELKASIQKMQHALELDPLSLPANTSFGELLHFANRLDEAIQQFHKAIELDPYKPVARLELGRAYETRRDYALAITEFNQARKLSSDNPESLASLAHCYAVSGEIDEARTLLAKLKELATTRYVSAYDFALLHCGLGEFDEALEWLNRSYEIRDGWMIYITVDPRWRSVRDDARFVEIVRRVGLNPGH
ncbi:MAG: tetratricopeptide repeat protein [Pyrinomonadaceae bacterium]